jgi:hypothetical protein
VKRMNRMNEMNSHGTPAATAGRLWKAVSERDETMDGAFVYAVRSTASIAVPSCPRAGPAANKCSSSTRPKLPSAKDTAPAGAAGRASARKTATSR